MNVILTLILPAATLLERQNPWDLVQTKANTELNQIQNS